MYSKLFTRQCIVSINYRPQRSCGQGNIFTPVCHSFCSQGEGVCHSACWDTTPRSRHPPEQTPSGPHPPGPPPGDQTPPGPHPPLGPHPLGPHPPRTTPPGPEPPPREADSSIRSTSGRYASYWNAFL